MNEPAFARPNFFLPNGDIGCVSQRGISQRRLLAGMILAQIVGGLTQSAHTVLTHSETVVKAAVEFADELIKQTEET